MREIASLTLAGMSPGTGPKRLLNAAIKLLGGLRHMPRASPILRRERDQARAQRDWALAEVGDLGVELTRNTARAIDLQVQIRAYDALLAGALDSESR
jgi:hypothetical protein